MDQAIEDTPFGRQQGILFIKRGVFSYKARPFSVSTFLVGGLAVMCLPLAIRQFHMGEDCAERRIFRTAGVDTELNLTFGFMQVADAHLVELYAIRGTFYAKIILSAAQSIPHGFYLGRDLGGGPIRPTVIGDHAAQMLKLFVLVFDGTFQPVFAVQIQNHATLVKTVVAFGKLRFLS